MPGPVDEPGLASLTDYRARLIGLDPMPWCDLCDGATNPSVRRSVDSLAARGRSSFWGLAANQRAKLGRNSSGNAKYNATMAVA